MKKIFLFCMMALVAMLGFTACDKETEYIYDNHSADLVGTWSCLTENYAEVLIINADGSAVSYGVENGEYWENVKGTVTVKENNITMIFEDDDNFTGHFDIIPGMAFSLFEDTGERYIYQYCANDLSEEIVGMWVSFGNSSNEENNMFIQTFNENGKSTYTGFGEMDGEIVVKKESNYKVIGDVSFQEINGKYIAWKLSYSHNGTSLGDIMTNTNGDYTSTWLRIKQNLDLAGTTYDYSSAYVSNAKGKDEDFTMLGHTFNMANINAGNFDMMFRSELFCVDLNTNTITQHFLPANGQDVAIEIPITVEGNKVTLDLSTENPAYRKVDMYMHTNDFINYFANMELYNLLASGEIDKTDAAAIEKVYTDMEARVESINVSFVMKARK